MAKIDLVCFGLRGFGNELLISASTDERVELKAFYSRVPTFEFRLYHCETIEQLCAERGIPLLFIPEKGHWECQPASLAIISSFHRIFRRTHLANYERVVNIHPSLLPSYKGATPTNWMAKNGERIIGVTAHLVDETVDGGEIIFQRKILNPFLFDNEIHRLLAIATRELVTDIISDFPEYTPPEGITAVESMQHRRTIDDATVRVEDLSSIEQLIFHIKAFTNYPMPRLSVDGRNFIVDYAEPREFISIRVEQQDFEIPGYWQG